VRSAAVVNAAIRAIVVRAQGRPWTAAELALYGLLLEKCAVAVAAERIDVVKADQVDDFGDFLDSLGIGG
jgi:hypothetical protein